MPTNQLFLLRFLWVPHVGGSNFPKQSDFEDTVCFCMYTYLLVTYKSWFAVGWKSINIWWPSDPTSVDLDHVPPHPPRKFTCPPKRDHILKGDLHLPTINVQGISVIFTGVSLCLAGYFVYQLGSPCRTTISLHHTNHPIPTQICQKPSWRPWDTHSLKLT